MTGGGTNLLFGKNHGVTKKLLQMPSPKQAIKDTLIDVKGMADDRARRLKCAPPCNPLKTSVCFSTSKHFSTNWDSNEGFWGIGGLELHGFADCKVKKICCLKGYNCDVWQVKCKVHLVFKDGWHWGAPGTAFDWVADVGTRSKNFFGHNKKPGCAALGLN